MMFIHRVHNELLLLHEFQSWHGKAFVLKRSLHNALFQSVNKLFVAATLAFAKNISYTINQIWFGTTGLVHWVSHGLRFWVQEYFVSFIWLS